MSGQAGYDQAVNELSAVAGFAVCEGCRDEIVVAVAGGKSYCEDCLRIDDALRWKYETRKVTPIFAGLPRVDADMTLELDEDDVLPPHCLAGAKMGQLVAVAVATVIGALTVFCLLGWYGLRALAALGIWLAA